MVTHDAAGLSKISSPSELSDMQDFCLIKKAEEIQSFEDIEYTKKCNDALKTVNGPRSSGSTLLIDKDATLERWVKHLSSVPNRLSIIKEVPQIENALPGEFPTITKTM